MRSPFPALPIDDDSPLGRRLRLNGAEATAAVASRYDPAGRRALT